MSRNRFLAIVFLGAAPAVGAELRFDRTPTVGLPGFNTWTVSIDAEDGETFRGVDARFDGPMNQVPQLGVFKQQFQPFCGWCNPMWDSHFSFSAGDVLSIGAEESESLLTAAFTGLAGLTLENPTPFAQIVTDNPTAVAYDLAFDLGGADPVFFRGTLPIPEPTTVGLAGVAFMMIALLTPWSRS